MQLILHTGAHFTEQDRIIKTLLRNKGALSKRGIAVPGPGSYRKLMRDTLNAMHRTAPGPSAREVLLDVMLDDDMADRLVLSDPNFFRTGATAVQKGVLYPASAQRMEHMATLFPNDEIEIFLGMRNPAALLPFFFNNAADQSHEGFWGTRGPMHIRWSDTITRIRAAVPHIPMTVWCFEDLPLIWAQVIRELAGLEHDEKINGGFDLLASIMSKEGMQRFRSYIDEHPGMSEMQKRRVIAAFLDKFALEDALEEELDMPGWTDALVDELTDYYDEDMQLVARIPGVHFISP